MGLRPDWKENILKFKKHSLEKGSLYINRLESVIFSTEMCILQTRTYWKPGTEILSFEIQKRNISVYRTQRAVQKNYVIRLVLFTPKVMVIRMSKMAHFMYFLLNTEKKTDPVWARYLNAFERSYQSLLQNTVDCGVLTYH